MTSSARADYFRRDQRSGITPPDLRKAVSHADHIVRARGKKTQYTSVSTDPAAISDFGERLYRLLVEQCLADGHGIITHQQLLAALQSQATNETKGVRLKAIQALRYARRRTEALVEWRFQVAGVADKDVINWAGQRVSSYFVGI